mgnify:CR=1 FL=1
MMKHITMSDIAQEIGVSTVTVSKALSDKEGVSDALREKIKKKAAELGYVYNSMAKSIKEGISGNIGILVSERYFYDNAFYAKLYNRNVMDFRERGYSAILEIISIADENQGNLPGMIVNNKIDGLVVLGQLKSRYVSMISELGLPFLFMDFYDEELDVDCVVSDNVYGSYLMTRYLIKSGHKKIAFVGNIFSTSSIMDRYLGYHRALLQNHLEERPEWVISDRDEVEVFRNIALPEEMPDAFVCNCDESAFYLISQLKNLGYRIPEDISIVGFDDSMLAEYSQPRLTTYRVALEGISETVVDVIIRKISEPTYVSGRKVVGGAIVVRESVAKMK